MAHHKSTLKSIRQDKKRHQRNIARKSELRTRIKNVLTVVKEKDIDKAQKELVKAISVIDRSCNKGTIHKNNAARKKTMLAKKVRALSA